MNLWTKEIIAENLRDLPAGVREVRQSDGSCRHQPLPESSGRSRVEEVRLCDWLRCAWNGMWPMDFTPGMGQSRAFWS